MPSPESQSAEQGDRNGLEEPNARLSKVVTKKMSRVIKPNMNVHERPSPLQPTRQSPSETSPIRSPRHPSFNKNPHSLQQEKRHGPPHRSRLASRSKTPTAMHNATQKERHKKLQRLRGHTSLIPPQPLNNLATRFLERKPKSLMPPTAPPPREPFIQDNAVRRPRLRIHPGFCAGAEEGGGEGAAEEEGAEGEDGLEGVFYGEHAEEEVVCVC
ncbi:hypothetical protein J4E90_002920 [Alternaria incomplexa]|uniref:uncharacterized protein n=1 Tax=Alternaria incomplexa TaxID=1187928 RepID=UPI00221ED4CD|nr:uncharacterized protein J4E90_002920 [Alternaria incomplexa]KAI4918534.1 hypothetical protein J4E90_002920 [Alternaria incomplexa]